MNSEISLPFSSIKHASIAMKVLQVDEEIKPDMSKRSFSIQPISSADSEPMLKRIKFNDALDFPDKYDHIKCVLVVEICTCSLKLLRTLCQSQFDAIKLVYETLVQDI